MIRFTLTFLLPFAPCYDTGIFSIDWMRGDGSSIYGIQADVLNAHNEVIYSSSVSETYIPPAPEMVPVTLAPGSTAVRCTLFGETVPDYGEARFEIIPYIPQLTIKAEGTNIVISWDQTVGDFWTLETKTKVGWTPSPATLFATDKAAFFRLNRKLLLP